MASIRGAAPGFPCDRGPGPTLWNALRDTRRGRFGSPPALVGVRRSDTVIFHALEQAEPTIPNLNHCGQTTTLHATRHSDGRDGPDPKIRGSVQTWGS